MHGTPPNSQTTSELIETWEKLAKESFGVPSLRAAQRKVLTEIATERDILATLPTGAGKTLLYTLPALTRDTPVLVICPLISLMRDQVRRMTEAGIPAVLFTSDQSEDERRAAWASFFSPAVRLIFASPERLVLPAFLRALTRRGVSMVVVDEAHCVASWGPSFRPEYARIGSLLQELNPRIILALTATASRASRRLITEQVFPAGRTVKEIVFSPLRENIRVECTRLRTEAEKWETLVALLQQNDFQRAIVYFPRRTLCDQSVKSLRRLKIHAVSYHAGLTREERRSVESYIHRSQQPTVICATQAFGMGVDLSGVTLVAVYGFPGSIEEFFQMIGRAGRGGEPSRGLLLWTGADPRKRDFHFEKSFPDSDAVTDALTRISRFFPGHGNRDLVDEATLATNLQIDRADGRFTGFLAALRILGCLNTPSGHTSLLRVALTRNTVPRSVILSLPAGRTRRSLLWEALERLAEPGWADARGATLVVPMALLCEESRLGWGQCSEILAHHAQRNELTWELKELNPGHAWHLIHGSSSSAMAQVKSYLRVRVGFAESLAQLERLARTTGCRLAHAEHFFAARSGAQASTSCLRCDNCLEKTKSLAPQRMLTLQGDPAP